MCVDVVVSVMLVRVVHALTNTRRPAGYNANGVGVRASMLNVE